MGDVTSHDVDLGEREAISLAVEIQADLILLDDRRGREAARAQDLIVTGTLGILGTAAQLGLIELEDALTRLRETNFRISERMINSLLAHIAKG